MGRPNGVDACPRCGEIGNVSPVASAKPMPYRCAAFRKYFYFCQDHVCGLLVVRLPRMPARQGSP